MRSLSESLQKAKGSVARGGRLVKSVGAKFNIPRIRETDGTASDASDGHDHGYRAASDSMCLGFLVFQWTFTYITQTSTIPVANQTRVHLHLNVSNAVAQ
jgi:hypothetical protein